jgi:hypothetical protein
MDWSSPARLAPTAGAVMQFGTGVRLGVALLVASAATALLAVSLRQRGGDASALRLFLLLVLVALGAATIEVFGVAHRVTPQAIERVAPWRQRATLRWSEVTSLEWSGRTRWYEVRGRSGARVRVYQQLTGMATFARAALEGVPAAVLDAQPGLRRRLELHAQGIEPPGEPEREEWRGG